MLTIAYVIGSLVCLVGAEIYVTTTCPNGWVSYERSCYLFADEIAVDWTEATHFCATHNSTLVVIDSHGEDLMLIDQANRLFKCGTHSVYFWIGATDDEVEGDWVWFTNHQHLSQGYTNWAANEPDDGNNQDCALLWSDYHFKWGSGFCSDKTGHAICEKRLQQVPAPEEIVG